MNRSVIVLDKFSVVDFVKWLAMFHTDKALQRRVDQIMTNLKHTDSSYREIVHNYFEIMHKMLNKQTRILKWILIPISLILFLPVKVWKEKVQIKSKLIDDIDSQLEQRMQQAA